MQLALTVVLPARPPIANLSALLTLLLGNRADASFVGAPPRLDDLKTAAAAGFDTGLLATDPRAWWRRRGPPDPPAWESHLRAAVAAYREVLGGPPGMHASTICLTPHGLRLTQRLGFGHASDTRGRHPFVPVWNGEIVRCPQFPVTLPALEELGRADLGDDAIRAALLEHTAPPAPAGHLFRLNASTLTRPCLELFARLLADWREQGYELVSVRTLAASCDVDKLPRHEIACGTLPKRREAVLLQGEEFPIQRRDAA